jgi:Putative beta-barrel porin-2, OmpL-like. bbp2
LQEKTLLKPYALYGVMAYAIAAPLGAFAASDEALQLIREQIRELKDSYEARMQALEQRLKEAETKAAQPAPASRASTVTTGNTFNPNISLILSGAYKNLSHDPNTYRIGGFIPAGTDTGPGKRGFSLAESELTLSANVDPFYAGQFTLSVSPENTVSVEEAFIVATALGNGLNLKMGRFFSGIGYLNEQHAHAWDFTDNPLAYNAFLGRQFAHDGVQVKWLAPTDTFLEFGAEIGNGSRFPGTDRNKNGINAGTIFAHTAGDIGDSHSWRAGLSYLQTRAQDRGFNDSIQGITTPFAFSGSSKVAVADFVWKWAPNGNVKDTNFKLQGEYLRRKEDGAMAFTNPLPLNEPFASTQSGWYLQAVYQFLPQWRTGLRYDRLSAGDVVLTGSSATGASFLSGYQPSRSTLMLDYNPSEFSRLRLQAAQDKSRFDITDNQFTLQYINSLGAHGAHKY